MGVVVRFGNQKGFLRQGTWRSADLRLEAQLNALTEEWIQATGGPKLDSSDPEKDVAREMAGRLGGKLLAAATARTDEGARRYFAQRQLKLFS